jgi:hypothetical protein
VTRYAFPSDGQAWLNADGPILGGASGGPVIDDTGRLLGVISWTNSEGCFGKIPLAHLALPRWVWDRLTKGE